MTNKLIFWSDDTPANFQSNVITWYRASGLGDFLNEVLAQSKVRGVILKPGENIFGFILEDENDEDQHVKV